MPFRFDHKAAKAARIRAGLKPEHVALATDKTKETILGWESGKFLPPMATLLAMCDLYGVEPADLYVAVEHDGEGEAVRRLRIESRRAQGLPDQVTDPAALDDGAAILSSATRAKG
jgi:DNA-binding XRE family transcriptional regulator